MSDIGRLLERLKSPNKDTRNEACEELRIAESLPQEAIAALQLAAKDEDALVAEAARRALLTHRLPPSRGQGDADTAKQVHGRERCPKCGHNEIEADRRYGNKLKGREGMRQAFRSPLYWIGLALLILSFFPGPLATGQIAWRYGLPVAGFVLILISVVRTNRAISGPGAATRYPEARYTCRICGHQWTSAESLRAAQQTGETEVMGTSAAQDVQPKITTEVPSGGKRLLDAASVLGICSIVSGLVVGLMTVQNVRDLALHGHGYENLYSDLLCCQFPGVVLGTLLAITGIVLARKQKSKLGLRLSMAGLILYAVLILASLWTIPRAWS